MDAMVTKVYLEVWGQSVQVRDLNVALLFRSIEKKFTQKYFK